ncbi:MAG: S41 family peptidase [Treponema sp.]|nr:S41 family peptidase [Treponema sp.]
MKKNAFTLFCLTATLFLSACASTKLGPDEELVEYKKIDYTSEQKKELTIQELREDCDMLKYLVYNSYAGIDEAIANGFNLDETIEEIYTKSLQKKQPVSEKIQTQDFITITATTFSKKLQNTDQHIYIGNSLKNPKTLYFSDVFFAPTNAPSSENPLENTPLAETTFIVKKCGEESQQLGIHKGMQYTGPETNLFEVLTDEGKLYRYGVMTNKRIKKALIFVDNQEISVAVKNDEPIPTKESWSGIKTTDTTLYISLGDCSQATGITDRSMFSEYFWTDYLSKISENTKGKKNIIFDLRSNHGGYREFPAKMLRAAYYYNNTDPQLSKDIEALMINITGENCVRLVSPVTEFGSKEYTEKYSKILFERYTPELQAFYKNYWKHIKSRPVRTHISLQEFATSLETLPKPDFQGDIYILLNQGSASAAEFGTLMAYELQNEGINVHIVGENSNGAFKYGGMTNYRLPHSSLFLYMGVFFGEPPLMQQNQNWQGEGNGFFPDYWATNDTILNTLEYLTKDKQLKTVLAGLDKGLL